MTEQYALQLAGLRAKRLNWFDYDHRPRLINVLPGQTVQVESNNQLHLIIEAAEGISVESANGFYDPVNLSVNEQEEEHTGQIIIRNRSQGKRQVRFIQVLPRVRPNR